MKRLGVLLTLLMLGSLFVGTGQVLAFEDHTQDVGYTSAYIELTAKTTAQDVNVTDVTQNATSWVEGLSNTIKVVYWVKDGVVHVKATFSSDPSTNARLLRLLAPAKMIQEQTKTALETILLNLGVPYDSTSVSYDSNIISGDVRVYAIVSYGTDVHVTFKAEEGFLKAINYHDSVDHANTVYIDGSSIGKPDWYLLQDNGSQRTIDLYAHDDYGNACKIGLIFVGSDEGFSPASSFPEGSYEVASYTLDVGKKTVAFHFIDGLTGQPLNGVTVKEGSAVLGTIDDGGTLELAKGSHTLTFEKQGYWSVTKTIDVENDTSLSVEMYPSSAAFKLENFPADISIPENTIYTLTFTLSPIQTSATHNTYLSISGLQNLISVKKGDSAISPENGKYYLGDISGPTQVSITFQAGAVGQHGFTLSIESHDAVMSNTYTTTKSVTYTVEPLPFSVQMPSEWQVGQNELRISESSGQSYLVTVVLKDSSGNEVWSASHAFNPYEAYTFTPKIPSEGSYTLELQFNGQTAVYSVQVNPAITLETKTLSVKKGSEGTIVLHFKNPSSDVQYYTIKVSGGFLPKAINQSISVAPATEKDVSIAFAVPDKLTYDAYELNVQVLQGNATVFSDKVVVSISDSSGFCLFGGGSSGGKTLYYAVGALVALGLFIAAARRR